MSIDFTVAIPTYNGAARLPALIARLRSQLNPDAIAWEVLVVDNNSSDDTAAIVRQLQAAWEVGGTPLRYCFAPEQGAAFARLCAVREARGALVGFLDDDTLPDPDWLSAAYRFSHAYPAAGAFGGQIHGSFEVEPPSNFRRILAFLAIREHGSQPLQFCADRLQLPPAACLVVRRQAWCDSVPARPLLPGKLPGRFVQGDDYEPLLHLHKAGWQIWYNPAMQVQHQIPRQRLEREYLLRLAHGCGLATCPLRMIVASDRQKPVVMLRTLLGNLRRVVWHLLRYRSRLYTDLPAAVELAFFWGSALSPFYYLKQASQPKA